MKARFMIDAPNEINMTMKLTMTGEEWEKLRDALHTVEAPTPYPVVKLRNDITDLLAQSRKVFYAEQSDDE